MSPACSFKDGLAVSAEVGVAMGAPGIVLVFEGSEFSKCPWGCGHAEGEAFLCSLREEMPSGDDNAGEDASGGSSIS